MQKMNSLEQEKVKMQLKNTCPESPEQVSEMSQSFTA